MANSILKLNVDTSEYDAKLKDAAKGIRHLADVAHEGAGDLTGLEKSTLDYVKAVGEMETKSRTAAGQVRELESTYKELKVIYDQLNEVEKADEGGKALAASLEQLKQRAQDARKSLDEASNSLKGNEESSKQDSMSISDLTSKLGINIKSLVGWGAAITASKVALDVAKDAIMSSESNVDDWGRTVQSAESIYQSFVISLNTGDFSGFLNNIGQVTQAAREAYNALDELGTRMTIINPERAKLQARQQELRATIRREGKDSDVGKQALAELKKIEPKLSKSFQTESKMNRSAFEALVKQRLAEGGINLNQKSFQQFMNTFSSDEAFQQFRNNAKGSRRTVYHNYNNTGSSTISGGWTETIDDRNTNQKLMDLFTDEWRKKNSGYLSASFQAQGAAASNALGNARYMKEGGSGSGKGKGGKKNDITYADDSIMAQEKLIEDLTKKWKTAGDTLRDGYLEQLNAAKEKLNEMMGKAKGPDFDKLFPDMSEQNYNTGYAGSAQSKYDSAIADLAQGPLNMPSIQSFITTMQSALAEADFGTPIYESISEKLKDATTMSTLLQELMERGMEGADLESTAKFLQEKLLSPEGIDQEGLKAWLEQVNKGIEEAGGIGLTLNTQTGEVKDKKKEVGEDAMKKFSAEAGKFVGGLGEVANGLRAAGISIPNEVNELLSGINGFMQIISGFQSLISMVSTPAEITNTTAIANLTAILTAKMFMPGMNNGGIVPHAANGYFVSGTHMSGDVTPIMANEGELVLNKAQQFSLAAQLTSGYGAMGAPEVRLSGEDLFVVMSNYLQRAGYGEILTSKG